MSEVLQGLHRDEVRGQMQRVEVTRAYTDFIANNLGETVLGQPEACQAVAKRVAIFETGFSDPSRPLSSIYELGPSGTGKTEMAHALSKYMFNDANSDRLKIINMAEFSESHTAMRFVGAPPSYVGYGEKPEISHDWLHAGRSIIVFDEAEKADPKIHRMMLSILDKGKINARNGQYGVEPLNFSQSFLFFTSNVGAQRIQEIREGRRMGFAPPDAAETKERDINRVGKAELKKAFDPEFIKRLDEIITFKPLEGREIFEGIFWKFITERNNQLSEIHAEAAPYFAATTNFRDFIIREGGNDARQIRALLERELFANAANVFMQMDISGKPLVADYEEGKVVFYTTKEPDETDKPEKITV